MKKQRIHKNSHGFTLIELMITVAISTLVIVLISSIYSNQQKVRNTQESVVDIQQNLRAGVYLIGQELRMAGYDPTNKAKARIIAATATQVRFTQDVTDNAGTAEDGDGDTNDPNENITLNFNAPTNTLQRSSTAGGPLQPMIQNVDQLEFRYRLDDGSVTLTPAANKRDNIRAIEISLLVRAATPEQGFLNNQTYRSASGAAWVVNDNFRRRLLITTIKCRNMGL